LKKITGLFFILALFIVTLTGCSGNVGTAPVSDDQDADFAPAETNVPVGYTITDPEQPTVPDVPEVSESTQVPAVGISDPTIAPVNVPSVDYTYNMVTDTSFGFTFAYPSEWINLPGKHTICFREQVDEGDVPARVTVTRKKLAHTPKASAVLEHFQAFTETVREQYDPETFEFGELNQNAVFMGQQAFEMTYLAYSGDVEVKGYMICCSVERNVYALHFSASYDDFAAMDSVLRRIRDSVTVAE